MVKETYPFRRKKVGPYKHITHPLKLYQEFKIIVLNNTNSAGRDQANEWTTEEFQERSGHGKRKKKETILTPERILCHDLMEMTADCTQQRDQWWKT